MLITEFFESIGAPLRNMRWSWGAVGSDGKVFLRVWRDEMCSHDDSTYVKILSLNSRSKSHGYPERCNHIDLIRQGSPCYMIVCVARDMDASHRSLSNFNEDELLVGRNIVEFDNGLWIQKIGQINI